MRARFSLVVFFWLAVASFAGAQTDNTFYVKQFKGDTVGAKVLLAMLSCNPNASIPCILVLDPSLATYAPGIMPALCGHCSLQDWRAGAPMPNPLTSASINGFVYVDGSTYPRTDAGIQAAVNAAEETGSTVVLSPGGYDLGPNLPITITSEVSIVGAGAGSTLVVRPTVGATTDVFYIHPGAGAAIFGLHFKDFDVFPASGMPARHLFNFDSAVGEVHQLEISGIQSSLFGGHAVNASGGGFGNGSIVDSNIHDNSFGNGIYCQSCGDLFRVINNKIGSNGVPASSDVGVYLVAYPGTSTNLVEGNDIQNAGGAIYFGGSIFAGRISNNQVQTSTGYIGSHGADIDMDGAAQGVVIERNSIQSQSSATIGIRVNNATNTVIRENTFERAAGGTDISITALATNTLVGANFWTAGGTLSQMVNDAGVQTSFDFMVGTQRVMKNNTSLSYYKSDGTGPFPALRVNSSDIMELMAGQSGVGYLESSAGAPVAYWTAGQFGMASGMDFTNANGVIIPHSAAGYTGAAGGKVVLSTGTGFSGSCASTTALTVVNGIITGCS
jgi:hypothetical protein